MSLRDRSKVKSTPIPEFEPSEKQVVMYYAKDDDLNRLYTVAYLEEETIDKIARRVVELMDQPRSKRMTVKGKKG